MKPLARLGARPLVDYVVDALRAAGAQVVLAVGSPDEATRRALEAMNLPVIDDESPGGGPAAGVAAALDRAPTDVVVVLACDTPFIDPATIIELVRAAAGTGVDGAVALVGGARQPLIAAYRRGARPAFEYGSALRRALDSLNLVELAIDADAATNVNTPEDLERVRRRSTWPAGGGR